MVFFTMFWEESVRLTTETKSVFLISWSLGTSPSATTRVQIVSSSSRSTSHRIDISAPKIRSAVSIADRSTKSKMPSSSAAVLCLSKASVSMKKSTDMPRRQPMVTPTHPPTVWATRDDVRSFWRDVRFDRGKFGSSRPTRASTVPPDMIPDISDTTWPRPAAAMVVRPSVIPMLDWIRSPAVIMTRLSMMPKPTIGMPQRSAWAKSWDHCGSGTGGMTLVAEAAATVLLDCRCAILATLERPGRTPSACRPRSGTRRRTSAPLPFRVLCRARPPAPFALVVARCSV
mmetsp:Transcript_3020/g.7985  ORF Transcript_3020/g.7985 Transcript_3020/m.7985 type:complete len:287 (+) Transcript_3020:383-1243(+)